jgi:hypothetical protein
VRASHRFYLRSAVILAVLVAVATTWGVIRGDLRFGGVSTPAPPAASPTTTAPSTGLAAGGARGCLGGENAEAAALVAHQQAPLTPVGAAEFAATLTRWYFVYPRTEPLTVDGSSLWVEGIESRLTTPQWPDARNGDSAYASFINGHYLIESATADTVVLSIQYTSVYNAANGRMNTQYKTSEVTVKAVDGHWRLSSARGHRQASDVIDGGHAFVRGC